MKTKTEKIKLIMSFKFDEIKTNHPYYKDVFKQYLKMDDNKLNIEFNYFKKEEDKNVYNESLKSDPLLLEEQRMLLNQQMDDN